MMEMLERITSTQHITDDEDNGQKSKTTPHIHAHPGHTHTRLYLSRCGGNILQPLGTSTAA